MAKFSAAKIKEQTKKIQETIEREKRYLPGTELHRDDPEGCREEVEFGHSVV
jgi:hypothetical protein